MEFSVAGLFAVFNFDQYDFQRVAELISLNIIIFTVLLIIDDLKIIHIGIKLIIILLQQIDSLRAAVTLAVAGKNVNNRFFGLGVSFFQILIER